MTTAELEASGALTRRFVEQEHRDLSAGIADIEEVAAIVEPVTAHQVSHRVRDVLDWFAGRLEEHLAWEDAWLYPQLDRLAGSSWVGRLMGFEHQQIRAAFGRLEADWESLGSTPDRERLDALRGRLYGLACVIRSHVEREEWLLTPLFELPVGHRPGPRAGTGQR
jgi:hemerythrin-like domain-containing protein